MSNNMDRPTPARRVVHYPFVPKSPTDCERGFQLDPNVAIGNSSLESSNVDAASTEASGEPGGGDQEPCATQPATLNPRVKRIDGASFWRQHFETHVVPSVTVSSRDLGVPASDQSSSIASSQLTLGTVKAASERAASKEDIEQERASPLPDTMASRLLHIRKDITRRASVVSEHIKRPPTPDQDASSVAPESDAPTQTRPKRSITSLLGVATPRQPPPAPAEDAGPAAPRESALKRLRTWFMEVLLQRTIDVETTSYLVWLTLVAFCFLYNSFAIPLRACYPYQTASNLYIWLIMDYSADLVYLLDMLIIQPRIQFMKDGLSVKTAPECRENYLDSVRFRLAKPQLDLFSLLPTDLLYFALGRVAPIVRIPRVLKLQAYWDMFDLLDVLVPNPVVLRISRTLSYMVYMIHCNSGIYYMLSAWEGFGNIPSWNKREFEWQLNPFVYSGVGAAYIRCFYLTTKLGITIGNNPPPTNVVEYTYMIISWMMGVFVFALLLGQISDIITNAGRTKETFRNTMDAVLAYCNKMQVPKPTIEKVRAWFQYTWDTQRTLNESKVLEKLPIKLQTDLAINVHYDTLIKVKLFQDADPALLRDLVLKLKPVLYLPGDYVCMKGEVGKEMYIVSKGVLEVVGGPTNEIVFVELKEGSVFGEISLLDVGGGNRRTANVRSKGFSNLFTLSKEDLHETLADYPDAKRMLNNKARQMLKKDDAAEKRKAEEKERVAAAMKVRAKDTTKMADMVANLLRPRSNVRQSIRSADETHGMPGADDSSSIASLHDGELCIPVLPLAQCAQVDSDEGVDTQSESSSETCEDD